MYTEQLQISEIGLTIPETYLGRFIDVFGSHTPPLSIYPLSHEASDDISHTITHEQIQAFSPAMLFVLLLIIEESDEESYLAAMENQAYVPTHTRTLENDKGKIDGMDEAQQFHATGFIEDLLVLKLCETHQIPDFATNVARYLSTDPTFSIAPLRRPLTKIRDVLYQIQTKDSALFEANLRCFLDSSYMIDPNWGLVVESFLNPILEFEKIPPEWLESATTTIFSKNQDIFEYVIDYLLLHISTQRITRKQVDNIVSLLLHNYQAGNDVMIAFERLILRGVVNLDQGVFAKMNQKVLKEVLEHIYHSLVAEPDAYYPVNVQKVLIEGWILRTQLTVEEICRIPFAQRYLQQNATRLDLPPDVAVQRLTKQQEPQQNLVTTGGFPKTEKIPETHYLPPDIAARLQSSFQWEELLPVGINLDRLSTVQVFELLFWFWTNRYEFVIENRNLDKSEHRYIPVFVKNLSKHLEHLLKRSNARELDSFCQVLAEKLNFDASQLHEVYNLSVFLKKYIEPELILTLLKSLQCVDYPTAFALAYELNLLHDLFDSKPPENVVIQTVGRASSGIKRRMTAILFWNPDVALAPDIVYRTLLYHELIPEIPTDFIALEIMLLRKTLELESTDPDTRFRIIQMLRESIFRVYKYGKSGKERLLAFLEEAEPSEVYAFYTTLDLIDQENPRIKEHILEDMKSLLGIDTIRHKIKIVSGVFGRIHPRPDNDISSN